MPTTQKHGGFLRRSFNALIAAQEREAERYVSRTLLTFDDDVLKSYGFDRKDLERRAARFA